MRTTAVSRYLQLCCIEPRFSASNRTTGASNRTTGASNRPLGF